MNQSLWFIVSMKGWTIRRDKDCVDRLSNCNQLHSWEESKTLLASSMACDGWLGRKIELLLAGLAVDLK